VLTKKGGGKQTKIIIKLNFKQKTTMNYTQEIKLDFIEISLMRFILEVTLNRQLNYLANNQKLIDKIKSKIEVARNDIQNGKSGFFSNPQDKLGKLELELKELISKRSTPEYDLKIARKIYDKILDSEEAIKPGAKEVFKIEDYFKDRRHMLTGGTFKDYFKIEHYIY
jgi:predicted rRNA methylase YqxC with S4 and FtsJ domains